MGIRYIFGRAGMGKTHSVLEEIKKSLEDTDHNRLILIVPEQFTLQAERDLIEKLDLPGIMDVEVLSFTRLAHKVLNEVGGITRIHINEQGKNMVLRKIIDEAEKDLSIYKKASQQDGFVSMFNELLCELKQHDVLPIDLLNTLDEIEKDGILYHKLKDIAHIYEQFETYLKGRYIDTEDYLNLLIEKMQDAEFLKDAEIWIDGFQSFTPQTYHIIEKIMTMAKQMTITFTMEFSAKSKDGDLFKISELTYQNINDITLKYGLPAEIIDLDKNKIEIQTKSSAIYHIEQEFYAYPYNKSDKELINMNIFAGLSLYTEIENVASKVVSFVRDKGYRWNDIAVVCNDLDHYGPMIKRVFEEYDIPYFLDQKRNIMHNPIIELILSALAAVYRGYKYEDVFRFFKTGFSGIADDSYEKLENYVLQYGVQGNKWKEPFAWGEEKNIDGLNQSREKFIEPMKKLEKKIKGKKTVGDITKGLYAYLQDIEVHEKLEKWIDVLREMGQYEYVNENTQIWNIVMEVFDQMVEIIGEQKITLKEYIRVLESGFSSLEVGIIPTTIDQVLVGNMQRSKSHDIKALFVVGVNDGILPSGKDDDGILSDEERISMKEKDITLGYDSQRKAYEEKFIIYTTFTKPSEYLWISYAMADQEGKAMRPSILIDRFKKIFTKLSIKSDVIHSMDQQKQLISTPKSTFKYLVENIRANVDGKTIEGLWWDVYSWYYQNEAWKQKREAVIEGFFHDNQVEYIESSNAKKLYDTPIKSSVSRLEQFVNCPFAHFVKYGLKPKERKMFEVKAPDIGDIFHQSMEKFTNKLKDENLNWRKLEKNQCDRMMEDVIEQIIPNYGNGVMLSTSRYKYLVTRLKRISKRAVWILTEHIRESGFEPMGYEVAFGMDQMYPPMEIELADGEKIYLEGRIDRVDLLEDGDDEYVKIIDYKSGNKEFRLSDVYYGLQLQLMIYLDAILKRKEDIPRKEKKPAGIFYFKIDDPMIKTEEKAIAFIEKEIRRKLKMKGLVLKDVNIVRQMDKDIEGYSDIIPVGLNKLGEFYSKSSAVDETTFMDLIKHVRKLVKEISYEMLKGNIQIAPCKNGKQAACDYCPYRSICQFDNLLEKNEYNNMKKLSDQEVIERIKDKENFSK
ncbi:helicase-exonuclease AddAB subunit AddB [Marinisporobacter balticus]|uniref:ATP-dependent helicase/deoxyribonuclease subunit B n=1 Tax=Marinisporobacter balticus TaxID=2018667 RepID=A0A4R2KF67_9FIRM|nr:helicase-exonuclease AddAB subunit AddB [Marinisporobacter balticus]TCO68996.1 DNA helicase/exodeoxyribonuclease V subunit B [Marinisporobacter balticus]